MLPPSGFRCEIRTHTHTHQKDKPLSPCFRCQLHETPGQKMTHSGRSAGNAIRTAQGTPRRNDKTLFALTSSWSSASPRSKRPSASALHDISLTLNFLSVWGSRLSRACNEQVACPYSRRNRPRSGLRIFGTPCHISQPTLEGARPPVQAKPALSALLA